MEHVRVSADSDYTVKTEGFVRKVESEGRVALSEYSDKDKKWDEQRSRTQKLSQFLYAEPAAKFEKWAQRMNECTRTLGFAENVDLETGEIKPKLQVAFFCHCRHCSVCDSRKSLIRMGRFKAKLPEIEAAFPEGRWIFLTLTVPNCHISELRATLGRMNKAWQRFSQRKAFKPVLGWIRATEVTQEKKRSDFAHPHFHVMLLVPASMISGRNYIKHSEWLKMWQESMRDDSITNVHVSTIKKGPIKGAVETLKAFNYSLKVEDLVDRRLLEYMSQVHKLRFLATGGVLKDVLKDLDDEVSNAEMIHVDDETETVETDEPLNPDTLKWAHWYPSRWKYFMK